MKTLLENWRGYTNLLKEAELQYSQTAYNEIYKFILDNAKEKFVIKKFSIPGKEVYYMNNPKIKNGALLFNFLNIQNVDIKDLSVFAEAWDNNAKKFNVPLIDNPQPIMIKAYVDNRETYQSLGSAGVLEGVMYVRVNFSRHTSIQELQNTIRHELQHVTQMINGAALAYGEQLIKVNGDFSKITKIELENEEKEFGTGKQKTGLRQVSKEKAKELGIDEEERLKRYLGDDFEYETWMSDLLSDLLFWSIKTKLIEDQDLLLASFKEKNLNLQDIRDYAKQYGFEPKKFLSLIKTKQNFNQLSISIVKKILQDKETLNNFAVASNMKTYIKSVETLLKLRSKEFAGDLVKNFELKLKNLAKSKYP